MTSKCSLDPVYNTRILAREVTTSLIGTKCRVGVTVEQPFLMYLRIDVELGTYISVHQYAMRGEKFLEVLRSLKWIEEDRTGQA